LLNKTVQLVNGFIITINVCPEITTTTTSTTTATLTTTAIKQFSTTTTSTTTVDAPECFTTEL
jgi:hypothetical protein